MHPLPPDHAEQDLAEEIDDAVPSRGYELLPVVGLGGSAGGIQALRTFFEQMSPDSGLAFVVVLHLSAEHESTLAELLQRSTDMPVVQVQGKTRVEPNSVYVIPPRKALRTMDGYLDLSELPDDPKRRHVAVDLFFRTLADTHGPHAIAVVLSGLDSDGAIGIKRIKERGGLTIAQDPAESEHSGMPRAAIATGMIDWVLPVRDIPTRLLDYSRMEEHLKLPTELPPEVEIPGRAVDGGDEASLRDVLTFLRTRTGRDFSCYKRATILRRIRRRMQVNGVEDLVGYLAYLRTRPGEAGALLQDLLITVTNFFRDSDCFAALEACIPRLFERKTSSDTVRVWVPACATGEEAYSIAMMMTEHTRTLEAAPQVQIFATDLDEEAIRTAREGVYATTIEADVSEERLRRFFVKEHSAYRIRREIREMVLFAVHDVLKDSPFSRLELVSCRNLLIYLNREPQSRVLDTFHFALNSGGLLFLGSSEAIEDGSQQFAVLDKKHRIYLQRSTPRIGLPVPSGPGTLALALEAQQLARSGPVIAGTSFNAQPTAAMRPAPAFEGHAASWGELHFKLLEMISAPSLLVDSEHEILHLSPGAGRFLQFAGGEPSSNLLRAIHPSLRIELRAALYQASQSGTAIEVDPLTIDVAGEAMQVGITVRPMGDIAPDLFIVVMRPMPASAKKPRDKRGGKVAHRGDPVAHHLDRELERLKSHLRDTVEQYEASTEELKASNEELQAMNEELRSATEELETSREELQSINEELTTVNQELKNKVDELGHSNSDMHNLMDATAIATIFLDRDLHITRYTPSAVKLFNLIPTDVGRPLSDLTSQLDYDALTDDARRVLDRLVPFEREVSEANGSWYLVRARPYRTLDDRIAGIVLTFVDVTERKIAEAALRASEERFRLMIENAVEYAIFAMDRERRITLWNAGAERLLGYTEAEIIGQQYDLLFTDDDCAAFVPQHETERALSEGRAVDDRMHVRKDGTPFWAGGAVMPIYGAGNALVGFVKILRDQSDARASREKLERSRGELEHALQEKEVARAALEAADSAKDRFLAVLSHELRNPLAAIRTASNVLSEEGANSSDRAHASQIIERQAAAVKVLLDDLLDIAKMRLGRLTLRQSTIAFSDAIERALETTKPLIDAAHHALTVTMPRESPMVNGDPVRLGQVLANLLTNAAKYTPPRGEISIDVRTEDASIICTITDTGIGIEPAQLESIFALFWQALPKPAHGDGFGIGLALARSITELHGGRLFARSKGIGHGSEFVLVLPALSHAATLPSIDEEAPMGADGQVVLLVDDDDDALWSLAKALELGGFVVKTAREGREALRIADELKPDVVVLDISMPGMQGDEVARALRGRSWASRTRLIAVSGWSSMGPASSVDRAAFDRFLAKPIGVSDLLAAIAETRSK
ncbi:MAG TPA: chemotaxis protein CheB [Rhodanobacteraceae bacterium]|nr:chemotaxis protein CheB [Rhodanobacteraceae bacterium]